jgi:hypothetical protein
MNKINVIYNQLIDYIVYTLRASPTGVLNGKLNIKKNIYYFGYFMFILHTPKEVLNKMLKYLFSPTNVIPTYLSKKAKTNKVGPLKK